MARTGYFDQPLPRIFAHRGLSQHAEIDENSIEAFQAAIAHGATHIESDVHATKDNVAVLFHDSSLLRVAGIKAKISQLELRELREIKLNYGSRIPTLAEGLELGVNLNLDIKSARAISPTVEQIERFSAHDRVLVSSFSASRRAQALQQLTAPVATSASMRQVLLGYLSHRLGGIGFSRLVKDLDAFQIPPSRGPIKFATEEFIARAKASGVEVHFWTINDPLEMKRLIDLGADGIVSDRVDLFS